MVDGTPGSKALAPLDLHVARRIRERRLDLGMSQQRLAAAVGVTFQQIQKYENGKNRIATSRLQRIGEALGVPRDYVYEGFEPRDAHDRGLGAPGLGEPPPPAYVAGTTSASESLALMEAFVRIGDPGARQLVIDLAKRLAEVAPPRRKARRAARR